MAAALETGAGARERKRTSEGGKAGSGEGGGLWPLAAFFPVRSSVYPSAKDPSIPTIPQRFMFWQRFVSKPWSIERWT